MDQLLRSQVIASVVGNDDIMRQLLALEARVVAQPGISNTLKEWLHWIVIGAFVIQFLVLLYFSRKASPTERGVINGEELNRKLETLLRSSVLSNSSDSSRVSPPPSPELSSADAPKRGVLTRSSATVLAGVPAVPAAGVVSPRPSL